MNFPSERCLCVCFRLLEDCSGDSGRYNAAFKHDLSVFYCYEAGVRLAKLLALSGCGSTCRAPYIEPLIGSIFGSIELELIFGNHKRMESDHYSRHTDYFATAV